MKTAPADPGILVMGDVGTGVSTPLYEKVPDNHVITVGPWRDASAVGPHEFTMSYPGWLPTTITFNIRSEWLLPLQSTPTRPTFEARLRSLEKVPDLTFADPALSLSPEPLAAYAITYHERWGLPVVEVDSVAGLVSALALAAGPDPFRRVRLLCEGNLEALGLPMFPGPGTTPFTPTATLAAFGQGLWQGVDQLLPKRFSVEAPYPVFANDARVETIPLRQYIFRECLVTNQTTFEPFGLFTEESVPDRLQARLIERSVEAGALRRRLARLGPDDPQRPAVQATLTVTDLLIDLLVRAVAAAAGASEQKALSLSQTIAGYVQATSLVNIQRVCTTRQQPTYVADLNAVAKSDSATFASSLSTARARMKSATLDVRVAWMGDRGLRTALGDLLGMPPRNVTGLVERNGFASGIAVETYSDAPKARVALAGQRSVTKALASWSVLFALDEWWDRTRNRTDPLWARLKAVNRLSEWLSAVQFLPVPEGQDPPPRILFYRRAGGLPPTERPSEAIEAFLRAQWDKPPAGSVARLRDEILAGQPVPVPFTVDYDRRRPITGSSRKEAFIPPDPRYGAAIFSGTGGG